MVELFHSFMVIRCIPRAPLYEEEEDYAQTLDNHVRCLGTHPPFRPLSQRGLLDPVKLAHDPGCQTTGS